jgi:hypothetical protein
MRVVGVVFLGSQGNAGRGARPLLRRVVPTGAISPVGQVVRGKYLARSLPALGRHEPDSDGDWLVGCAGGHGKGVSRVELLFWA